MLQKQRALIPVKGSTMEKVYLPFFYGLGTQLNPLTKMTVEPQKRVDIYIAAWPVRDSINGLLGWSVGLKVCEASARAFLTATDEVFKWLQTSKPEDVIKKDAVVDAKFQQVINTAKKFETVLNEELATLSAYSASKKGIYSTSDLIDRAENIFPPAVLARLSKAIVREIQEAGKCLAFDIPTASGFHMLRAMEEVLHSYYLVVCKPENEDKLDNWGAYITALHKLTGEKTDTNAKTKNHAEMMLALLQQIKDQDRNLIMHPEVTLNADEALKLFEITKGAIMTMAEKLSEIKPSKSTS
jgi:hypothetical protein